MTPRKELFIKLKEALESINKLELVDYYRNQFENGAEKYGNIYTAALIRVNNIQWVSMTGADNETIEGQTSIDVILYCKDGWMDQHQISDDPENGLMEIDLIDNITDLIHGLKGESFKPMQLSDEAPDDINIGGIMSYKISFTTTVYKPAKLTPKYTLKKINLTQN